MVRTKSIELLNAAVAEEMQSIHQYLYFHIFCEKKGYKILANLFDQISVVEMKHLEILSERILRLGGNVRFKLTHKVAKTTHPKQMINMALAMESQAVENYNMWGQMAMDNSDTVSQKLFEQLAIQEMEHAEEFEIKILRFEELSGMHIDFSPRQFCRKKEAELSL